MTRHVDWNHLKTPSDLKCYPCLQYKTQPSCPGRTLKCGTSQIIDSMLAVFWIKSAASVMQFWPKRQAILTQTGHSKR